DFNNVDFDNGLDAVTDRFIQNVLNNSPRLIRGVSKSVFTPSTLFLQADYRWNKSIYVNGLYAQSIQFLGAGPVNGSMLAITPRLEDKWYSISLPISLYQWQKVRVGLAARLG
ncbi:MAG TPA: DUF5723 family protein, partial [Saprospiraceae bacterium]|nr:DUF5723 family protein [Saprospiraceae bacterium]